MRGASKMATTTRGFESADEVLDRVRHALQYTQETKRALLDALRLLDEQRAEANDG
jgi:hypothetical protein